MNVDISKNNIYFLYENEQERIFIHNLIEFCKNILKEQKEFYNVSKDLKKIIKKTKKEIFKKEGEKEVADLEVIDFLLDNAVFLINTMEKKPEDFQVIERVAKDILKGIKANKN